MQNIGGSRSNWSWVWGGVLVAASLGCDAASDSQSLAPSDSMESASNGSPGTGAGGRPMTILGTDGHGVPEPRLDERPVVKASRPLPPVSGGTLLAVRGGEWVVASDPHRDRISVGNLRTLSLVATISLEAGAQPGRLVEDGAGRVHVVLRGPGEVLSFEPATRGVVERRRVCATPRGIAFEPTTDRLVVACAEGKLVDLPAGGVGRGGAPRSTPVDIDVRDVVIAGDQLRLTRFRAAELLELGTGREVVKRRPLPEASARSLGSGLDRRFVPNVAWRAVPSSGGSTIIVHQRALADEVHTNVARSTTSAPPAEAGPARDEASENVASARSPIVIPTFEGGSPYGDESGCGGIVQSVISIVEADGSISSSRQLADIVLPVDVAVSPSGTVFVASAAVVDGAAGGNSFSFTAYSIEELRASPASTADPDGASTPGGSVEPQPPCIRPKLSDSSASAVAVAYAPERDAFLLQTREPAEIILIESFSNAVDWRRLSLGGESVADTGYELFHTDAGGGIACASCHPEGTEDGHTWLFSDVGPRRTQPLDVGLRDTAPFHWDGALADLGALMDEVFTRRMGGLRQGRDRVGALEDFLARLEPRPPLRAVTDAAAVRGKALFESSSVGCARCHSGTRLSDNTSADIGKGSVPTQTPSLLGVAYRAPLMHDGCAPTLLARFEPACGGTRHGDVTHLGATDLDDLVAYLESL